MSNTQNMLRNKYRTTPLSVSEARKSNILISGTNQQGKSLCAMSISDILMNNQWQVICFDNVGVWKNKSTIPLYYTVSETSMKYILPKISIIFDISLLLPSYQKEFVENVLADIWRDRIENPSDKWLLVVFEEFQLYARNVRGNVSQNILRIMSVGANHKIRCLGITPDMSLIDCAFIRLAQQRYHFKLGNEPNAKRRFRAYYSKDWCRIVRTLDVGFTIYVNKEKLKVHKIPLFISQTTSQEYTEPQPKAKPKLITRIINALSGSEEDNDVAEEEEEIEYPIFDEDFV